MSLRCIVDTSPGHFDLDPEGMFAADVALHLTDPDNLGSHEGDTVATLELEVTNVETNEKLLSPLWVGIELTLDDIITLTLQLTRLQSALLPHTRVAAK